jgi:O-antigen ligase
VKKLLSKLSDDRIIIISAFALANLRATIFIHLFPDTSVLLGPAWIEIALWFFLFLVMLYSLVRKDQLHDYLLVWRRNWLLALFLLVAWASTLWSLDPIATMFRASELMFASFVGAYMGMRYRPSQLMESLFWFGAILLILSIAMAWAAPKAGTMYWQPFEGAWRGLFWHRNHLSSLTALLSILFLCRAILAFATRNLAGILDVFFYVLSVIVLFFARSATGYILFLFLHVLVLCVWGWLKLHPYLRPRHYYLVVGMIGVGSVLILSNLDIVFGLFHRDATLTGRVGLWTYLLNTVAARRPWWGTGFGAAWTLDWFREDVRQHIGWPSQPLIADNGFLDILLHLGVIGIVMLLGILVMMGIRSIKWAISRKQLADFFPLLFVCYVLMANIPFSLIAETEVFIWFLIIAILFMTMPSRGLANEMSESGAESRKKLADAAVLGGDYRVTPAPGTAQGALLHQELNFTRS